MLEPHTHPFVVAKGYHMGSKWFEEAFNQLPGCGFMFEYEHCLRTMGRHELNGTHQKLLAPPGATLRYLQHGCRCPDSCAPSVTCHIPAASDVLRGSSSGGSGSGRGTDGSGGGGGIGIGGGIASRGVGATADDERAHRSRERRQLEGNAVATAGDGDGAFGVARAGGCRAVGVSFGALGPVYIAHLQAVLHLEPRVAVVVHVRSNHVKHGLSFLRTSCLGEANHLTAATTSAAPTHHERARLHVPPPLLILRAWMGARAQDKVLKDADAIRGARPLAYVLQYEAMQRDLHAELSALLRAVGAPMAHLRAPIAAASSLVKAGIEDVADLLSNAAAAEIALRPLPRLHSMLVTSGPVAFGLRACETELASLPAGLLSDMEAERLNRSAIKVGLHPAECSERAAPRTLARARTQEGAPG